MIWLGGIVLLIVLVGGAFSPLIVERKHWVKGRHRAPKSWQG
jgi:hypothetical protein